MYPWARHREKNRFVSNTGLGQWKSQFIRKCSDCMTALRVVRKHYKLSCKLISNCPLHSATLNSTTACAIDGDACTCLTTCPAVTHQTWTSASEVPAPPPSSCLWRAAHGSCQLSGACRSHTGRHLPLSAPESSHRTPGLLLWAHLCCFALNNGIRLYIN